ncbi:uncharacterized protein TNCV_2323211 [Trichonephila clavipes]|nr:uncharacterized protein TNCV_2323211 [Trichonephila clavipes]
MHQALSLIPVTAVAQWLSAMLINDFVQSTPGFQECDEEDVETWMACDVEDYGFQMLNNDDEIVTSVQEESDPVDD